MTAALALERLSFLAHHCDHEWMSTYADNLVKFYAARPEIRDLRLTDSGLSQEVRTALWNAHVATSSPLSRPQPSYAKLAGIPTTEAECWARYYLSMLPNVVSGGLPRFPFGKDVPAWSYTPVSEFDHNVCSVCWEIDPETGVVHLYHSKSAEGVRGPLVVIVAPDGNLTAQKCGEYDIEQLLEMEDILSALGARLPLPAWLGVSSEGLSVYVAETKVLQQTLLEETHPVDLCFFNRVTVQATLDSIEDTWHRRVLLNDPTIVSKWPEMRVRELRQEAVYKICARKGIAGFNPYRADEDTHDC